jgi:hypothetical protein
MIHHKNKKQADKGNNIAQLNNIESFGTQFTVFRDHDSINIMTGTRTSAS